MRNLKKVVALIAVFAMMVSTVAFAAVFDDVDDSSSYSEAIETLNKLGILTGDDEDGDGNMSFRPDDSITRAEIAVIVSRIQGVTGATAQTDTVFTDVPSTHWASGYIASATNMGIVNGYGDGTFGPDDNVLYEEVIKMLMSTLGYEPYASSNGGYPTGYILAAQRQGVLSGVSGGSEGTQATRGQVAQMTYNAIDTPLMERYSYGSSSEYVIFDGTSFERRTLMSTALGIAKIRGIVEENDVTSLTSASTIDTEATPTVVVYVEDNYLEDDDDADYPVGYNKTFYAGDTDAADYLGYDVILYAIDSTTDTPEIISIVGASGKNTTVEFTLDQYDSIEQLSTGYYQLGYMKNDTDRTSTKIRIDSDADIIYNGIAYTSDIEDMFGDGCLVDVDSTWSGRVTCVDNDDTTGYDVVFVDISVSAVVDDITSKGVVMFKEAIGSKNYKNSLSSLDCDSSDTGMKVTVKKDGEDYDYTALEEWDVLSIIANTDNDYYQVEVLGENAVTGTISRTAASTTSSTGTAYTISGVEYDLAEGAYTNGVTLKAGSSGTFYIDGNNKIVAYDRSGTSSTTSDNYAYVVKTAITSSGFDSNLPSLQVLYKDGQKLTLDFSSSVTIDNPTSEIQDAVGDDDPDSVTFKYDEISDEDKLEAAIDSMAGLVVTLSVSSGYVKSITLPSDNDGSALVMLSQGTASYDEDDLEMRVNSKRYDIAEDTLVFYIGTSSTSFAYNEQGTGSIDDCSIGYGADLSTNDNFMAALYADSDDGDPTVAVLYNTDSGIATSTGLAYVTSIGRTTVDGSTALSITYYQDGELLEAVTDGTVVDDLSENVSAGSIFKFGITNDTITSARSYLLFDSSDNVRDEIGSSADLTSTAGMPNATYIRTSDERTNSDEDLYYGAVVQRSGSRLTLALVEDENELPDFVNTESVNLGKYSSTNYYLYDPERSSRNRYSTASIGDINVDKYLTNNNADDEVNYTISLGGDYYDAPAVGCLDYVYIRTYDTIADCVIYAAYDYDYDIE